MNKSALSNIPVYYMSLFKMSCEVALVIEKYQRNFLCEGCCKKKDHLMKWSGAIRSKKNGGLEIER